MKLKFLNLLFLTLFGFSHILFAHEDHSLSIQKDSWAKGYTLMLLGSNDIASTIAAQDYVESLGGKISIVIPPRVMLGWLPPTLKETLQGQRGITFVTDKEVDLKSFTSQDENTLSGLRFFNYVASGSMEQDQAKEDLTEREPITNDALVWQDYDISRTAINAVSGNADSMTGRVAVSIFFVESNGAIDPNTYTWNQAHEIETKNLALSGLAWWTAQAPSYSSSVTFTVLFNSSTNPVCQQPYEPILHSSDDDDLWINAITANLGYSNLIDFNTAVRTNTGANWAYSAFIAYNPSPAPGTFTNGRIAYAYFGGPYTQLLYTSMGYAGWTFTHETGHIFWACDEYASQCSSCGPCTPFSPRPTVQNRNCESCSLQTGPCIMKHTNPALCEDTPLQIGWGALIETRLVNGVPVNDSISSPTSYSAWDYFFIDRDSLQSLSVELFNLNKDADLYIAYNRKPTASDYDCRSIRSGTTEERCIDTGTAVGRWWIGVNNAATGTINYTIQANTLQCLNILNLNPLPQTSANVGAYVSQDITTNNGTAPYEYSIFFGNLPPGLVLYGGGWLTGYPSQAGSFNFFVSVVDRYGCTGTQSYTMNIFTCTANIQVSPSTLPAGNVGVAYTRTISATGGTAPYTATVFSGTLPPGLFIDNLTRQITGTPTTGGSYPFTIRISDANGCFADQPYNITINAGSGSQFSDEFDDNVLRTDITYQKGNWNETGGSLSGSASGKALVIFSPAFSGCTNCTIETTMKTAGGKVWLRGWYKDSKNFVELNLNPGNDKWTLKQYSNGTVVATKKVTRTINPNTVYKVKVSFNGTNFEVFVDDVLTITMPAGATPFGTAAFQAKATTVTIGYLRIN